MFLNNNIISHLIKKLQQLIQAISTRLDKVWANYTTILGAIQIIRDKFWPFLIPLPPSPVWRNILIFPKDIAFSVGICNFYPKIVPKLSRDTLFNPLPPPCVIWWQCRDIHQFFEILQIYWKHSIFQKNQKQLFFIFMVFVRFLFH